MVSQFHIIYISLLVDILDLHTSWTQMLETGGLYRQGWVVHCKVQPNSYDCSRNATFQHRFYYDLKMQACMTFEYGYCDSSFNNFYTMVECYKHCRANGPRSLAPNLKEEIYCRMQPDFGDCNSYFPMFYYDISHRKCRGFSYSGCGGNYNKFSNPQVCMAICDTAIGRPAPA